MKYLSLLPLLLLPTMAQATTRYLAPIGTSGCSNGTTTYNAATNSCGSGSSTVHTNANSAIGAMSGGDTLYIRTGTYVQPTVAVPSGTSLPTYPATAGATLISNYNGEVVIFSGTAAGTNFLYCTGATNSYVILNGVIWDGASTTETLNGGCSHVRYSNMEIKNNVQSGVFGGDHNEYQHNHIHHNGALLVQDHGMYISGTDNIIEDNEIDNNRGCGVHIHAPSAANYRNIVRRNIVHDNGVGVGCAGILVDQGSDNQIYNNVAYNHNNGQGILIWTSAANTLVYNNTLYNNIGASQLETTASASGTVVKNNIIHPGPSGAGSFTDAGSGTTSSNNLCTTTCGFGSSNQAEAASTTFTTPGSVFTLKAGSAAINGGVTLSTTPDIANVARPQGAAYDIGAYEFASGAPVPTVTITGPTSSSTLNTAGISTIIVSGTSSIAGGAVTWTCDRCVITSGSATGTSSWTTPTLTLKSGISIITITHTTGAGGVGTDTLTVTYPPTFPGNSLVLAFGFDEGSGTSLTDASGVGNTGTAVAAPTWVGAGRYGNALQFNGTNQYIQVLDDNSLDFTQSFTISLWVKPAAVATDFRSLVHKNAGAVGSPYELYASVSGYCGSGGVAGFSTVNGTSGPSDGACYATPLPIGTWTHVAVTWDGTNVRLYTQGTLRATQPHTGYAEAGTGTLQIAATEFGEYFQGVIDELRIYNFALPLTGGANTGFGAACNATDAANVKTASIVGDANCPVIPLAPPITFKVGASTTLKLGASSTTKIGSVPQ